MHFTHPDLTEAHAYATLSLASLHPRPHAHFPDQQAVTVLVALGYLNSSDEGVTLTGTGEVLLDTLWLAHASAAVQLRARILQILRVIAPMTVKLLAKAVNAAERDVQAALAFLVRAGQVQPIADDTVTLA